MRRPVLMMMLALLASTVALAQVDFTSSPDRLFSPEYQLPDGWEELVGDTEEISHFNYGALEFDPATVMNGERFEELTGVAVEPVVVAFEDMAQKISTAVLSQSPTPDIFDVERHYIRLAEGGLLVNLDDLWTEEIWSHYPEWVRDDVEIDGHYYAVPQLGQQWGFYYRPSLLEEAGFEGAPATKDELLEAAQAATTDDVYGYAFAAGDNFSAYEALLSILYMMDGRLVQEDGEVRVDTEEAQEALQFLHDLIYEHEVAPASAPQLKEAEVGDLFVGGRVAMMGQWDYHFARATDPETSEITDDVVFTTPPSWNADTEGKVPADFQLLGVNKFSKNQGAATLFLDYIRSQEAHANELLVEGNNTLVLDVYDTEAAQTEVDPGYLQAHVDLADVSLRENYRNMPEVIETLGGEVQAALAQAKSVDQALSDAQAAIDRIMAD